MNADILKLVVDSNNFTVGGGSASAIAGAMAAGMVGMVAKLSMKKPVNLTVEDYEAIVAEADSLAQKLMEGAIKDTEAYCMIKDAYALPKNTDEEKQKRAQAIQAAGIQAATVPCENGQMCKRAHALAKGLEGNANPAASSDLLSAAYLSEAGVKGCVLNVEANMPLIKDPQILEQFQSALENLK